MKIAIVHDWLAVFGGAEKVLKAMLEIYPDADVFSIVDFLSNEDRRVILKGKVATTSFIQYLPLAKKHFRHYLPLMPLAIRSLDVSAYDLVISSSWAFAKSIKTHPHQTHICYCHTPIRYAWDLFDEYIHDLSWGKRQIVKATLKAIRRFDVEHINGVDEFIANSHFVGGRIKKTYGREARVIYPPVDTHRFEAGAWREEYYLVACRLVGYKKVDVIIKAFNQMPHKYLVVVGDGECLNDFKSFAGGNVSLMGYVSDGELEGLMSKAKAFVYAALEDFGIVPVEAMSCGTPVIALNQGGTVETVIDGVNGMHFDSQEPEAIIEAVERFEGMAFDPKVVRESTQKYSVDNFKSNFKAMIDQCVVDCKDKSEKT